MREVFCYNIRGGGQPSGHFSSKFYAARLRVKMIVEERWCGFACWLCILYVRSSHSECIVTSAVVGIGFGGVPLHMNTVAMDAIAHECIAMRTQVLNSVVILMLMDYGIYVCIHARTYSIVYRCFVHQIRSTAKTELFAYLNTNLKDEG